MAYDELLAQRIRKLVEEQPGVSEKKMFGGLAFLVNGNMAVAASSHGGLLVRVNPSQTEALLASGKAQIMVMRGHEMPGWLRVPSEDVSDDTELARWAELGVSYAQSLAPR